MMFYRSFAIGFFRLFSAIFFANCISSVVLAGSDPIPHFGEIIRNSDGTLKLLTVSEAILYCESNGGRLPTTREWAQFATFRGAKIKEVGEYKNEPGYYLIEVQNQEGKTTSETQFDHFYFNYKNYKPKADDISSIFWTPEDDQTTSYDRFAFVSETGWLYGHNSRSSDHNAVRCVF